MDKEGLGCSMTDPESSEPEPKQSAERKAESVGPVGMVMQLGFVFTGPVVVGTLGAYFAEQRYGGGPLLVVAGVLIGVAAGCVAAYRVIKPYLE